MSAYRPVKLPEMPPQTWATSPKDMQAYATAAVLLERSAADRVLRLAVEALKACSDQTRHPDYDWPLCLSHEVDAALSAIRTHLGKASDGRAAPQPPTMEQDDDQDDEDPWLSGDDMMGASG